VTLATLLSLGSSAAALAQVPAFSWAPAPDCALARSEAQGIGLGNKLYVMSGFYNANYEVTLQAEVYDVVANTWTPMANIPEAITHTGTVVDGDYLYIVGGYVGTHPGPITDHAWRYHIPSNTWSPFVPLPAARGAGTLVRLDRELHFFGGCVRVNGTVLNDTPEHWTLNLDAATPAWVARAPLPSPTNHLGGAALNGKVYAIGGQLLGDEGFGNQNTLFEYNPGTNTWTARANLPRGLGHITNSVFTLNNRIVVVGGRHNGWSLSANIVEYNPATNTWRDLTPLPTGLLSPVAGMAGGRLVVNGGDDGTAPVVATTWRSATALGTQPARTDAGQLAVWPNPGAAPAQVLRFDSPLAGTFQIQVSDALGRTVAQRTASKPAGAVQQALALDLRPGLYRIAVRQGEYQASQKLVVE